MNDDPKVLNLVRWLVVEALTNVVDDGPSFETIQEDEKKMNI